ncbi:hypothetical protein [Faecalimicrobium sp. JNUCC 81]
MAKKSSTIHIEECFWKLIDKYQTDNKITSRNSAIEYILTEYKALQGIKLSSEFELETNLQEDNVNDPMIERLKQIESDMMD